MPTTTMSTTTSAIVLLALLAGCRGGEVSEGPPITAPFADDFERTTLGGDWHATHREAYQLVNGALNARGAYNHPLWLRRKLPPDAIIELDVWGTTPDGDLKVEIYGDGRSHARDRGQYTSTGYVAVMGGWSNSVSVLVAGNEHRKDRPERRSPKVEPGKRYRWKLVKQGGTVDWFVDDMTTPFLSFTGEALGGPGHEYLGINNWESDAWYDNLTITPL
jgi:hypothetical protein